MTGLPDRPTVVVLGATGAVGRVMLDLLIERAFPAGEVRAVATRRSAGSRIPFGDSELTVTTIEDGALEDADLVLVDTPDEVALEVAPKAVDGGALVIDNSAAFRMIPGVPLVVPEINAEAALSNQGIVASPNCTTIGVVVPLWALHIAFGLESFWVASYQAVSGAGRPGVDELTAQVAKVHDDLTPLAEGRWTGPDPEVFAKPIAFNAIPAIGSVKEHGYTSEEIKVREEARKIMGLDVEVSATCVRIPSLVGHGSAVRARFRQKVDVAEAVRALTEGRGVEMVDMPTPLDAAGRDPVLVGRVRVDPYDPHSVEFFCASDNLRKGAALNAVQIAESLIEIA